MYPPSTNSSAEAMAIITMHTCSSMPSITEQTLVRPLYTDAE